MLVGPNMEIACRSPMSKNEKTNEGRMATSARNIAPNNVRRLTIFLR